jgi:hypothetical protein
LFPLAVPTGDADALDLSVPAGQHFLDRAASGGAFGSCHAPNQKSNWS